MVWSDIGINYIREKRRKFFMCWPGGVATIYCQVRKARHTLSPVCAHLCAANI